MYDFYFICYYQDYLLDSFLFFFDMSMSIDIVANIAENKTTAEVAM